MTKRKFKTIKKSFYFSRSNDDAYNHNEYFLLKSKKIQPKDLFTNDLNKFFIGLIFTRKIGKAVLRNKIRRRIKAIFEKQILTFENFAYILIAKKQISELNYKELELKILESIIKINFSIRRKYCFIKKNHSI
jgi:ribonuclease P protein component